MKKYLRISVISILISLSFHHCKRSDYGVITGIVTDSITHKSLTDVKVSILLKPATTENKRSITSGSASTNTDASIGKTAITASDGAYLLDETDLGNVTLIATGNGYNTTTQKVFVTAGKTTAVNIILGPAKPKVETGAVSNITPSSASTSGTIKELGINNIIHYGHCWSSTTNPTLTGSVGHTTFGAVSTECSFTSAITNLQKDKIYYVRAYATTSTGITTYGNTAAFTTFDIDKGLIYYFPFDGDSSDLSGNHYKLFSEGGGFPNYKTTDRFGNSGKACHFFKGKWFGDNTPGLYDFAVSLWFRKTNVWESSEEHLFQIGDDWNNSNHDNRFYVTQDASPQNFNVGMRINGSFGADYRISLNSYPTPNEWHHLVAQRSGSTFSLYMDGVLRKSITVPSDYLPPSVYFNIGGGWVGTGTYEQFLGDLDELRLYNRALNNVEIQYLRNH